MQLIEKYSLDAGINPESLERVKPYSNFLSLDSDNFILFSSLREDDEEKYPFLQEVFDILKPILDELGINYYFLPKDDNEVIIGCQRMSSKITVDKATYLAERSTLMIGHLSYLTHLFSICEKPFISIERKDKKNKDDAYKRWVHEKSATLRYKEKISEIKPEEVAKAVFVALGIEKEVGFETLYIGERFPKYTVEVVPDLVTSNDFAAGETIAFRLDFLNNPRKQHVQNMIASAMKRKCAVVISDPIESIFEYKKEIIASGIQGILFNLKRETVLSDNFGLIIDYISRLSRIGKRFLLGAKENEFSEMERKDLRLKFLDICNVNFSKDTNFEGIKEASENGGVIKSTRFIFSNRKKYLSKQAYIEDKDVPPALNAQKLSEISDLTSLEKELESSIIYIEK